MRFKILLLTSIYLLLTGALKAVAAAGGDLIPIDLARVASSPVLEGAFTDFATAANTGTARDFFTARGNFQNMLDTGGPTIPALIESLDYFSRQFSRSNVPVGDLLSIIYNRRNLALIDQQLDFRTATRGNFGLFPSADVRNSLSSIVGRIFKVIVSAENHGNEIVTLGATGSAILVCASFERQLLDLYPYSGAPLNAVLSAAHIFTDYGPYKHLEVYFVPAIHLNNDTGLPNQVGVVTVNDLIRFLRTSPNSLKVNTYRHTRNSPQYYGYSVYDTEPSFLQYEDLAIGYLAPESNNMQYRGAANIRFIPSVTAPVGRVNYYAVGYAGCNHYLIAPGASDLLRELRLSPLWVTLGDNITDIHRGLCEYNAPTATGMSGGPLLMYDGTNTISIFGVITMTQTTHRFGCKLS